MISKNRWRQFHVIPPYYYTFQYESLILFSLMFISLSYLFTQSSVDLILFIKIRYLALYYVTLYAYYYDARSSLYHTDFFSLYFCFFLLLNFNIWTSMRHIKINVEKNLTFVSFIIIRGIWCNWSRNIKKYGIVIVILHTLVQTIYSCFRKSVKAHMNT